MTATAAKAIITPKIPPFIREIRQTTIAKTAAIGITISANIAPPFKQWRLAYDCRRLIAMANRSQVAPADEIKHQKAIMLWHIGNVWNVKKFFFSL